MSNQSYLPSRVLKLNVGYLMDGNGHQNSKDIDLDLPAVRLSEDLTAQTIQGTVRVSRTKEGLLVQGTVTLAIEGDCYRCLEHTVVPVQVQVEELYANTDELSEEEAEFRIHDDGQLDLAPLLRAEVLIQTTIGVRCDDQEACTERMRALEDAAGIDHIDPRMAALKQLLDNPDEKH